MLDKTTFLLILLTILSVEVDLCSQTVDRSNEVIRAYCPVHASDAALNEAMIDFYVAAEFDRVDELDSMSLIVEGLSSKLQDDSDSASYFYCKGLYHVRNSQYEAAQANYTKAGILFEKTSNQRANLYVRVQMATINYYLKQVEKANQEFLELLDDPNCDDFLRSKLHHNVAAMIMEIDGIAWHNDDISISAPVDKRIQEHIDHTIAFSRKSGYLYGLSWTYSIAINRLLKNRNFKEAQALADTCDMIARSRHDEGQIAFVRIKKATILDSLGLHQAAIDTAQLAVDYYKRIGNIGQEIHAKGRVMGAQVNEGKYKDAFLTARALYDDRSVMFNKELADAHQRYEVEFETEKKEMKIREQESLLAQNRLKISNRNRLLVASIFGALAIGSFFLFLMQRNKRRAQEEKDALIIQNKQAGIKAMIQAQEEERQRIAKDLHDGIVQQLGGLKLGLQKQLGNSQNPESERLIAVLDDSTQELRELSHRMMPRSLKELGLIPALEDMLENSLGMAELTYEFEHYGINKRLPESIEITLYRIAQELINNVIKHSRATRVNVQLFKADQHIVLIVEDNGRGFENSSKNGIGLLNISSRLDTVNGRVDFEPSPESGTLATIRIPLST